MTINEMRQQRARVWQTAKDFLDAHPGVMSAEDTATYEKMEAELVELGNAIDRAEKLENMKGDFEKLDAEPIKTGVNKGETKTGRESDGYKAAFMNYVRTRKPQNALQEDTNSEGGYLVPVEFERVLYEARDKVDPIFQLAGKISLGSLTKNVPYVASEGAAALIAEEGSYGDTDDAFGQVTFHAYKFGRICKASDELIADSAFDIFGHLAASFGRAIGKKEAEYFWTGTGSSQPQGVLTGAGTGVTAAATGQITADEILDLYFSLGEEYRANAVFVFHDSVVKMIRKLKTGDGQYLWAPGFNGTGDTILGKPFYTSSNLESIAAGKKVGVFGDFGECFKIADRQGFNFKVLPELYAANGQVGFRGDGRTDSRCIFGSTGLKVLKMHA